MLSSYPHRLLAWFADLLFPYRCLGCQAHLEKKYLCDACLAAIPIHARLECVGCGQTSPAGLTCPDCRPHFALDRIFVVTSYHEPLVAEAVKALKYKFLPEVAQPLAELAATYIQNQSALHRIGFAGEEFLVTPVPLHARRENWRGFNQAALIAKDIAARFRLEYQELLTRDVHLAPQASIADRHARFEHVKQAYACRAPQAALGRNILLVDDVCTTGATLNECARVLKNAGAASVSALVIARG